jgi:hypothetical protein
VSPPAKEVLVATLLLEDGPRWWDRTPDSRTAETQRQALVALRAADRGFGVTHVDGSKTWTMRFAEARLAAKLEGGLDAGGGAGYRLPIALVEQ